MQTERPADVPLHRVLPLMGRNVGMTAQHLVVGRLRFLLRTGLRIYVPREDYLDLCEAAWDTHVRRLGGAVKCREGREQSPPAPSPEPRRAAPKPIHDGLALDRFRRSPVLRLAQALGRWLHRR